MSDQSADISNIMQYDGNASICENKSKDMKKDKITAALNLPVVATYNVRSFFPKIFNFRTDVLERKISVSFVSEIWEGADKKEHQIEIEKMLEEDGLKYNPKATR